MTLVKCDNCEWQGPESNALEIKHLYERVSPGSPMPSGECPLCGALCYEDYATTPLTKPGKPNYITMVEVPAAYPGMEELMASDDVAHMLSSGSRHFPSMYGDVTYPELLVPWDSGEGPYNPEGFNEEHLKTEGWAKLNVFPQAVWDMAKRVAKEMNLENSYCVFWFRGEEDNG